MSRMMVSSSHQIREMYLASDLSWQLKSEPREMPARDVEEEARSVQMEIRAIGEFSECNLVIIMTFSPGDSKRIRL